MKLKTLENVLSDICRDTRKLGIPLCLREFKLFVWTDTVDCKPIVGMINIYFNGSISEDRVLNILQKIDSVTPISMISFDYAKYHITKTEDFMKKPCSCSLDKGCK